VGGSGPKTGIGYVRHAWNIPQSPWSWSGSGPDWTKYPWQSQDGLLWYVEENIGSSPGYSWSRLTPVDPSGHVAGWVNGTDPNGTATSGGLCIQAMNGPDKRARSAGRISSPA
jgi:hypothetical protein